jgi:putative FmdB family regulatory protein
MPLYEYICITCGNAFEHFVRSASSQEGITCPECAGTQVSKQFSTFGVKGGSGFSPGSGASANDASCSTGGG